MKEIKDMTDKELVEKLEEIEQQIESSSYGRFELSYREELYGEVIKRDLELNFDTKITIQK